MAYVRVSKKRAKVSKEDGDIVDDPEEGDTKNKVIYDEIAHVFKCRYMTSMEAFMRMMSYVIVSMSHTVITLRVHAPAGIPVAFAEGFEAEMKEALPGKDNSQLTEFFEICTDLPEDIKEDLRKKQAHLPKEEQDKLLYNDVVQYYSWTGNIDQLLIISGSLRQTMETP